MCEIWRDRAADVIIVDVVVGVIFHVVVVVGGGVFVEVGGGRDDGQQQEQRDAAVGHCGAAGSWSSIVVGLFVAGGGLAADWFDKWERWLYTLRCEETAQYQPGLQ